jgi:signal peptidase II
MSPKYKAFIVTFLLALGADQATKMWARASLRPHQGPVTVINGYWEFRYAENTGAAFSFLRNNPNAPYLFAGMATLALVVIGAYLWRARPDERLFGCGMGMLAAGALGNLIDRVAFGRVTDFVVWRVGNHVWPTFNVADALLLLGVLGLLLQPRPRSAAPQS